MVNFGLFNPGKYGKTAYLGYNLKDFDNHFRSLHVIKHRNGEAGIVKGMWFDGLGNKFEELPLPDNKAEIEKLIKKNKNGF